MFIVKSTERDCKEYLKEDQVKAWCSFSEIYADYKSNSWLILEYHIHIPKSVIN